MPNEHRADPTPPPHHGQGRGGSKEESFSLRVSPALHPPERPSPRHADMADMADHGLGGLLCAVGAKWDPQQKATLQGHDRPCRRDVGRVFLAGVRPDSPSRRRIPSCYRPGPGRDVVVELGQRGAH